MLLNRLEKEQYIIVDNLFTKKDQRVIKDNLFDPFFPWYLIEHRNKKQKFSSLPKISKQKNVEEYVKFVHLFSEGDKNSSKYSEIITSMIKVILQKFKLNELQIIRAKANLQTSNTKTKKNKHSSPHVDMNEDHFVILYYVNNSDGDTRIFDKTTTDGDPIGLNCIGQFEPSKGRSLVFKSNRFHCSAPPVKHKNRMVLNFVMQIAT